MFILYYLASKKMEVDNGQVNCPICDGSFVQSEIERHVDSCLLNSEKEKPPKRRSAGIASMTSPMNTFFKKTTKRKLSTTPGKPNSTKKQKEQSEIISSPKSDQSMVNSNENNVIKVEDIEDEEDLVNNSLECNTTVDSHTKQLTMFPLPKNELAETLLKWSQNKSNVETSPKRHETDSNPKLNLPNGSVMIEEKNDTSQSNANCKPKLVIKNDNKQSTNIKKNEVVLGKSPLADQMRPCSFDQYFGQEAVNSKDKILKELFTSNNIPSLILWGPPGCGKVFIFTSLGCIWSKVITLYLSV